MSEDEGENGQQGPRSLATRAGGQGLRRSDEFHAEDAALSVDQRELSTTGHHSPVTEKQQSLSVQINTHTGPLPSAETFAKYENVLPGAADRILRMAEDEGKHRRTQESLALQADISYEKRGQRSGLAVFFGGLATGGYLLHEGISLAGVVTLLSTLGTMVGAVVWNRVQDSRQQKLQEKSLQVREEELARRPKPKKKKSRRA